MKVSMDHGSLRTPDRITRGPFPWQAFLGISWELGGTLPTPSTGLGQPGHRGHSVAATAAGAFGTGSVFATTLSPSMGACLAWDRPWNTRNATFCPVQVSGLSNLGKICNLKGLGRPYLGRSLSSCGWDMCLHTHIKITNSICQLH